MVGCLIWFMMVRPDIMCPTVERTQHMPHPTNQDMVACKRIYAYLKGTLDKMLTFSQEGMSKEANMGVSFMASRDSWSLVSGYVDANLAKPMSITGYCFKMGGGAFIARCKKQPVPSIQTHDSELYSWSMCTCGGIWLYMALWELNKLFKGQLINGAIVIHGDNAGVIRTVQEQAISTRARHIALRWYHFMHAMKHKVLEAHKIGGKSNPANCLSKPPDTPQGFIDEANDLLGIAWMDKWNAKVDKPPGW